MPGTVPQHAVRARRNGNRSLESGYAKFCSRSRDAVIRVYDEADNVIETHEQAGDLKEWSASLVRITSIELSDFVSDVTAGVRPAKPCLSATHWER
jgi:hypothetical protein